MNRCSLLLLSGMHFACTATGHVKGASESTEDRHAGEDEQSLDEGDGASGDADTLTPDGAPGNEDQGPGGGDYAPGDGEDDSDSDGDPTDSDPPALETPGFHDLASKCANGIQDLHEEATDCGGACRACLPPPGAQVFYVSESIGNDSYSGTLPEPNTGATDGPWKTLGKMNASLASVPPGSFVLLRRGDRWAASTGISIPLDKSGTENAPITVGSYGLGVLPIVSVSGSGNAFESSGFAYFHIEDLELRGTLTVVSRTSEGVHHLRFRRLVWDGAAPGDETGGTVEFLSPPFIETAPENWQMNPMHHIEFGFCQFQNCSYNFLLAFDSPTGDMWIHHNEFYNSVRESLDLAGGDNLLVEYNIISGGKTQNGIKIQAQYHTIDNVVVRGNLVVHPGTEVWHHPLILYNSRNALVYNNTFVGNNAGSAGSSAGIFGWSTSAPVYFSGLGAWGFDNNHVFNNLFVGVLTFGKAEGVHITFKDGTNYRYYQNEIWDDNYFEDNVVFNPKGGPLIRTYHNNENTEIWYDENTPGHYANNLQWDVTETESLIGAADLEAEWLSHPNVADTLHADPMFVNPTWSSPFEYGDYHLRPGSPAIGAGCYPE